MALITGTTDYDLIRRRRLRDRGRPREDRDQARGLRRARRRHPRPRRPRHRTPRRCRSRRSAPRPCARRRSSASTTSTRRRSCRWSRSSRVTTPRPTRSRAALQLRPGDPQAADRLPRDPGLRGQPHPQLRHVGDLARAGGAGPVDQEDRRGHRRRERHADAAVLPHRPARPRHRLPRRRAPAGVLRRPLLRLTRACRSSWPKASSAPSRAARASTTTAKPNIDGRRRRGRRRARQPRRAEVVRRGVPDPRGPRLHRARDRPRADGRRRPRPAARPVPAVHEGRRRGPRHGPREARGGRGAARRPLRAADAAASASSPRAAWAPSPATASTPIRSPTTATSPSRSSSRPAATWRIAWLANGQMNSIAPQVIARPRDGLGRRSRRAARSARSSSPPPAPVVFSAGADIKAFTQMDEEQGRELLEKAHALFRDLGRAGVATDRRGQLAGLRRRLRAGDGLRRPDRRRLGRRSASRRSSSGSSRASAAPSACRGSSARARRSR